MTDVYYGYQRYCVSLEALALLPHQKRVGPLRLCCELYQILKLIGVFSELHMIHIKFHKNLSRGSQVERWGLTSEHEHRNIKVRKQISEHESQNMNIRKRKQEHKNFSAPVFFFNFRLSRIPFSLTNLADQLSKTISTRGNI